MGRLVNFEIGFYKRNMPGVSPGMPVDTASIRRFLLAKMGEPTPQPTEAGVWLVHEFTGEPYFVVVQSGPSEDALHYRQTPNLSGEWVRLSDSWPTVGYPELDIACWKME